MKSPDALNEAVSRFGAVVKPRLSSVSASGSPEDQLRGPLETLFRDLTGVLGFSAANIVLIGESAIADLHTRPDYAVTKQNSLVGFIELKAPGKGADPRRFFDKHDREQWEKLRAIPNLLYTDGNAFSLWQDGELRGEIVRLEGSVESSGAALPPPPSLLRLLTHFLSWQPTPPPTAVQLADISARLCPVRRDEA